MAACSELVLGNDRVCSEAVGFGVAQIQLRDEQCVACHLQTGATLVM